MKNPINNAVELVSVKKLVICKRCGCGQLAWIQLKSTGRWALVNTSTRRPFYHGENSPPEAPAGMTYAVKMAYHRCEQYQAKVAREELMAIHPKADKPSEILADAASYLVRNRLWTGSSWAGWDRLPQEERKTLEDALALLASPEAKS